MYSLSHFPTSTTLLDTVFNPQADHSLTAAPSREPTFYDRTRTGSAACHCPSAPCRARTIAGSPPSRSLPPTQLGGYV